MREYDLDSALRKFRDTTIFYKHIWKDGITIPLDKMKVGIVRDIQSYENYHVYSLAEREYTADPEYIQPRTGWYHIPSSEGLALLTRRAKKTYKIGICDENYRAQILLDSSGHLTTISPNTKTIDFLNPLIITKEMKETALESNGPISRTLWLQNNRVLYLNKTVGYRKGTTFFVNDSVRDLVGNALKDFNLRFVE